MVSVEIVQRATEDAPEKVVRTLTYGSALMAERAKNGIRINLNHERFYVRTGGTHHG